MTVPLENSRHEAGILLLKDKSNTLAPLASLVHPLHACQLNPNRYGRPNLIGKMMNCQKNNWLIKQTT